MTCYRSLRVLDKAAHGRGPACTQSGTREAMRLCGQEGTGREVARESTRDSARRDGKGRPARGLEVLSKMLCFSASYAILSQSKPGHQGPTNCLEETSRAEFS